MSRAAVCRTLVAAAVVVVVVSCARNGERAMGFTRARTPLTLNVSCPPGNPVNLSLVDGSGKPAWVVEMVHGKIKWMVPNHVTINGVVGKAGQQLPIEPDPSEPGGGRPFKLKSNAPQDGTPVSYSLDVTCTQNGNTVRLIIDPEFIVHR